MALQAYTVYALAESETYLIYYVGLTDQHYLQRFRKHWSSNWKIQELLEQGIDILAYPLYRADNRALGSEYEQRWIYHCIQQRQPIVNHEVKDDALVRALQQSSDDFINLPQEAHIWGDVILPLMGARWQRVW